MRRWRQVHLLQWLQYLPPGRGPARGRSHVARLNFKTSRVGVYKCLSLIVGFAVTVAILLREVVSCCNFILRAVATFWAASLVGIYPGRASRKTNTLHIAYFKWRQMNFSGNTKITWKHTFMITKKTYIWLCFQIFPLHKTLFVMNRLLLFKELSKIFKNFLGKFRDFSRTWCFFKDFLRPVQTMCQYISFKQGALFSHYLGSDGLRHLSTIERTAHRRWSLLRLKT